VPDPVQDRLNRLSSGGDPFVGGKTGLEKESLRVTAGGYLAQSPHPEALGSALTHHSITTDYSEALLEFITPPREELGAGLLALDEIHRFSYDRLGREMLWATSMPCMVTGDAGIPIARYGNSNVGLMKHVYRRGLGFRYGRVMQIIAGVHFNYSLPETFWPRYQEVLCADGDLKRCKSAAYFHLIRNFHRLSWLIPYLFGSSPAVCKSFLPNGAEGFQAFDKSTFFQPFATSLRMSDIGYKNKTQQGLDVSCDSLEAYTRSLCRAINTPHPDYEAIGVEVDGEYRQLNANLLQIENEFYSFVRPKQIAHSGEQPTLALQRRGVAYVEVRALDVSAFDPLGINEPQLRFLEAFLLYCLLADSPPISTAEWREINENQKIVACRGRDPSLTLQRDGRAVGFKTWAGDICDAMRAICEIRDGLTPKAPYTGALNGQLEKIADPEATPSARILAEMRDRKEGFFEFGLRKSLEHRDHFRALPLADEARERFTREALASLQAQRDMEQADEIGFRQYLERYFKQTGEHC